MNKLEQRLSIIQDLEKHLGHCTQWEDTPIQDIIDILKYDDQRIERSDLCSGHALKGHPCGCYCHSPLD